MAREFDLALWISLHILRANDPQPNVSRCLNLHYLNSLIFSYGSQQSFVGYPLEHIIWYFCIECELSFGAMCSCECNDDLVRVSSGCKDFSAGVVLLGLFSMRWVLMYFFGFCFLYLFRFFLCVYFPRLHYGVSNG